MAAKLLVPTALRGFTDRQPEITLEGGTAGELLEALASRYPDIRPHLFDEQGALRGFINVFVDDQNIKTASGLATPVKEGSIVMVVPAIAGGSGPAASGLRAPCAAGRPSRAAGKGKARP
ncbi:MAG: MoaD/ThiS family protein [Deltaproteobacteria bacterium]|jgi:molybdopterin converting factor small subunit|nr:MoaD/ThiS family protein [Deltaproteobacteria bacterium]